MLIELERDDAVVAIVYENPSDELLTALNYIQAIGCGCILITNASQLALQGRYSVVLATGRGGSNVLRTAMVTISVPEAPILAIAQRDCIRTAHAMHNLEAFRDSLAP